MLFMNSRPLLKCAGIFVILIIFSAVLSMVEYKVSERQSYRDQATQTVAKGWSHPQLIAGPVLRLSFERKYIDRKFDKELKQYVEIQKTRRWSEYRLFSNVMINASLEMQERYIGIFNVPVYTAKIALSAAHLANDLRDTTHLINAQLLISIKDIRGLANQPLLAWNDQNIAFKPGTAQQLLGSYIEASIPLTLLKSDANLKMDLNLRGVKKIGFVPTAQNLSATLTAPWPHPSFIGNYLPSKRTVNENGFSSNWTVNSFASSIERVLKACTKEPQQCANTLQNNQFGVHLGNSVDVYQMTDRALKYGFMFIALTFVVFALLELQRRYSIHPIQYGFVAAALAIFYLLVISLSEHIEFKIAYAIGSAVCTFLICSYLRVALGSTRVALSLSAAFVSLYTMMYAILQSEDYAFLMGTLLVFALLAGIMFATRNINWQQLTLQNQEQSQDDEV